MSESAERDDGINREGLNYRTGWCEALRALASTATVLMLRSSVPEISGIEKVVKLAGEMHSHMLDVMSGKVAHKQDD